MSFLQKGVTLKDLLQNPQLLNHPERNNKGQQQEDGKKLKDIDIPQNQFAGQSAFLGQQLWDKTLPYDVTGDLKDFKLEYMDLDEFLSENCIPSSDELNQLAEVLNGSSSNESSNTNETELMVSVPNGNLSHDNTYPDSPEEQPPQQHQQTKPLINTAPNDYSKTTDDSLALLNTTENTGNLSSDENRSGRSPKIEVNYDVNPGDLELACVPGDNNFDPRKRAFSEEELRPQPIIKKSKKIFVPDDCKDDKYWQRRSKNNIAAKRSREARRIKENQITLRAAYLEKETDTLKDELKKMKEENKMLKLRLKMYEK